MTREHPGWARVGLFRFRRSVRLNSTRADSLCQSGKIPALLSTAGSVFSRPCPVQVIDRLIPSAVEISSPPAKLRLEDRLRRVGRVRHSYWMGARPAHPLPWRTPSGPDGGHRDPGVFSDPATDWNVARTPRPKRQCADSPPGARQFADPDSRIFLIERGRKRHRLTFGSEARIFPSCVRALDRPRVGGSLVL
jgi:hypothetical protein